MIIFRLLYYLSFSCEPMGFLVFYARLGRFGLEETKSTIFLQETKKEDFFFQKYFVEIYSFKMETKLIWHKQCVKSLGRRLNSNQRCCCGEKEQRKEKLK